MTAALLQTHNIAVSFGGVQAVRGVTLTVLEGERRVIIGPNGAGKTTFFNLCAGQVKATSGQVSLFGRDVTRLSPPQRARMGLSRTFQISRLFRSLTVFENVLLAAQGPRGLGVASFRAPDADPEIVAWVTRLLEEWELAAFTDEPVQNLSHGNQRLLEIVLSLSTKPRLLMLDEPTAGLSGGEREMVTTKLSRLPSEITLIMTDHDMDVVFGIADRIMVLDYGEVVADGTPEEIRANPRVHEIYFGAE
jgi:branched-chain amino acid transport system ATP-binding protein